MTSWQQLRLFFSFVTLLAAFGNLPQADCQPPKCGVCTKEPQQRAVTTIRPATPPADSDDSAKKPSRQSVTPIRPTTPESIPCTVHDNLPPKRRGCHPNGWTGVPECRRQPDFPPGAVPLPSGTHSRRMMAAQGVKAAGNRLVIYQHEWFQGGRTLGPGGYRHLNELIAEFRTNPQQILIEPQTVRIDRDSEDFLKSDDELYRESVRQARELDAYRRQGVIDVLSEAGIENAEYLVVLGYPRYKKLYGDESFNAYQQFINPNAGFGGRGNRGGGFNNNRFGGGGGFGNFGGFGGGFGGGNRGSFGF